MYQKSLQKSNLTKEIKQIILIIEEVLKKITEDTDVLWTDYDTVNDLKNEIHKRLLKLKKGDLKQLALLKTYFLPTGIFQEIALSNNWGEHYLELANSFDLINSKITNNAEFIIFHKWKGEKNSYIKKIKNLIILLYNKIFVTS